MRYLSQGKAFTANRNYVPSVTERVTPMLMNLLCQNLTAYMGRDMAMGANSC